MERASDARAWVSHGILSGSDAKLAQDARSGRWYITTVSGGSAQLWWSDDRGATWDSPGMSWEADSESRVAVNGELLVDGNGTLHAVWSEHDPSQGYQGVAIWHGWQPAGESGMRVREVSRRAGEGAPSIASPTVAASEGGVICIAWNNGVGTATGRFMQCSDDRGVSWPAPQTVYPGLSGQTRQPGLIFDANGTLHFISAADGFGYPFGVARYGSYTNGRWSPLVSLAPEAYPGEFPSATLVRGNQLVVLWNALRPRSDGGTDRAIAFATATIDAPSEVPPGFARASAAAPRAGATAVTSARSAAQTPTETQDVRAAPLPFDRTPPPSRTDLGLPLAILSSVLVVGLVVGAQLLRRRR